MDYTELSCDELLEIINDPNTSAENQSAAMDAYEAKCGAHRDDSGGTPPPPPPGP